MSVFRFLSWCFSVVYTTKCVVFNLKMQQNSLAMGWGCLQRFPDSLAGIRENDTEEGRGEKRGSKEGGEGTKKREGKGSGILNPVAKFCVC